MARAIRKPLSVHDGFAAFAEAAPPAAPAHLTLDEYRMLGKAERRAYDAARHFRHANLGPYALGDAAVARDAILALLERNEYLDASKVRPGAAIDGEPSLGKTTLLSSIGGAWYRQQRGLHGATMEDGETTFIPVCYVTLPGASSIKGLNLSLVSFYGLPTAKGSTSDALGRRAKEAMRACGTSLVLIDDLHFIRPGERDGRVLSDHLKNLMSEIPATFVFAGVELEAAGIFGTGKRRRSTGASAAQTGERLRRFPVGRISIADRDGMQQWRSLIAAISADVRVCGPSQLTTREAAEYLHRRTTGSIGALTDLVKSACVVVMAAEADGSVAPPSLLEAAKSCTVAHGTEERSRRSSTPITKTAERIALSTP